MITMGSKMCTNNVPYLYIKSYIQIAFLKVNDLSIY